ncbi:hypothetical protein [Pseudomonas sp. RIT-PI-AD]|uniref:hypothetical protein n=1 Tax=Pseudomonas sp. RIT-PI-AD TaxID=3035294 RepID=UPI0021D83D95|nr:hypothetical protein [Pseudomonas sp. RIT-PI-AD]
MTRALSWEEILLLTVAVSAFLGFLLALYMTFIAHKYLDEFEAHLKRSSLVINNRKYMGDSLVGRMYRLLQISSCLSMPGFSIRKGQLDPNDALEFPEHLARKIVWPSRFILLFVLIIMLVGGYGKYFNGFKL